LLNTLLRISCVLTSVLWAAAPAAPVFDVNLPAGLDFSLQNSPTGGRVTSPMPTPENFDRHDPRYWNRLYRQNKHGSFTDVTQQAGLANAGDGNYGMGVAAGDDYDNDGYPVTGYGKNILYHNNGDGTLTDVTTKAGVAAGGWSVSAGFFDYDNDGKLNLFVTRTMDWDTRHSNNCGGNYHTYCSSEEFPATTNILYHNNGDGTCTEVSQRSAAKKGRALAVAFADCDGDGFTDIFVANDGMQQYLFHNNGNGTFTEVGLETGATLPQDGRRLSGMGVVFRVMTTTGGPT
jgi:enediyne biosynthesis protein E4